MVQKKGKRALITALSILIVLLAVVGTIAIIKAVNPGKSDPYIQQTANQNDSDNTADTGDGAATNPPADNTDESNTAAPTIDPATVSTIDIVPMNIVASYSKGIGAFEYEVLRRPNGTRYVEFSSPALVGTKCTDDKGTFVSILESPAADETATLAKTTVAGGTTFGLSLAAATCTGNVDLLKNYQAAFSDPFSLLKKLN